MFIHEGRTYKKGDVVISDKDLQKVFPEKFDNLGPVKEEVVPEEKDEEIGNEELSLSADIEAEAEETEEVEEAPPEKPAKKKKRKKKAKSDDDDDGWGGD